MAGSGSNRGGSGGGLSGANKVAMAVAGGTLAGLIIWFNWPGGGADDVPAPTPVVTVVNTIEPEPGDGVSGPTAAPASAAPQAASADREAITAGYPEGALLTITAFGMVARVGATFEDEENSVFTRGMFARDTTTQCVPDEQYPDPCIYYWLVKSGTVVTVTAGEALAGWWPSLEYVRGPGCDLTGNGLDQTCTLTLAADVELVATYYGGESPGNPHYTYPVCPTRREGPPAPPAWTARCR